MKKLLLATLLVMISMQVSARVKQSDLDLLKKQFDQKIASLQIEIDEIKEKQDLMISTESDISKLTDFLNKNDIKIKIRSIAADKLLETKTAGVIQSCMEAYVASLPAKKDLKLVVIDYIKADDDFHPTKTRLENDSVVETLRVNVKYWGYDSFVPSRKSTECFDVVYTSFIKN